MPVASNATTLLDGSPLWTGAEPVREGRFMTADFSTNGGGPLTAIGVTGVVDQLYATLRERAR